MFGNLLIKAVPKQSLDSFVASLPDLIGCDRWEETQSPEYRESRYFRCMMLGFEITASLAEHTEFKGYDFRICFESERGSVMDQSFLAVVADTVARKLTLAGYEVIRPVNFARANSGAIAYRPNPDPEAHESERVLTTEI